MKLLFFDDYKLGVLKGEMARAKAQLRVIKTLCGTECEEYEDLAKAIGERT